MTNEQKFVQQDIEDFHITEEPFYVSTSDEVEIFESAYKQSCLLYTSPSPRDLSTSRMPSSA